MRQPLAITGIGCRFPGGGVDPEAFWRMLCQGVDAVTEVPASRWPISVFYDPEKGKTGKTYSKWGSFLPDVDQFDADFFGIPDSEANVMDPQQRLLLQIAWESMEDAGYVPNPHNVRTGVFVGISTRDYELIQGSCSELNDVSPFSATGLASSIAANRISYCFNFTGPSMIVDTACSSSLMAVHLACQSLWNQECEAAIAAGVNCLIGPSNFLAFSSMGLLSPDGRCRSFDSRANGFVRGEGAGAILLEPLEVALARNARIYSIILATGANQDGHTPGLAFPNRESQAALLRQATHEAGVNPHDLVYIEAHGTGTQAGDPVEASALGEVFGTDREDGRELLVGSVKSNIGHLESGAGIAGIIKCALCLHHGAAPPNLHFERPNPAIDLDRMRLKVPTQLERFPVAPEGPTNWYAGVNSFGFGGSNAFVLLKNQTPPLPHVSGANGIQTRLQVPLILPISTQVEETLPEAARRYAAQLDSLGAIQSEEFADLIRAASTQRAHHRFRMTVVGRSAAEMRDRLRAFTRGEPVPCINTGEIAPKAGPVFVFSGQGSQWYAMGRRLYDTEPVFRDALERCHQTLKQCGGWDLIPEFLADEATSRMMDTAIAQPAICAIQIALVALWEHWGVRPVAAIGHSVGEVAAAFCSGVFTLEEAMRVIFHRGHTMARATGDCGMLAAALREEQALEIVAPYHGAACIGAVNSPQSVTLSGEISALTQIGVQLAASGIWNRPVPVNYAFHSRQMDPVREPLLQALGRLNPQPARIPLYSTVTGHQVQGTELDANYWWRNVRETVRFGPALEEMAREGFSTFLEVAAHPVLSTSMKQTLQSIAPEEEAVVLPTLRRQEDDHEVMLHTLGALHCRGADLDWNRVAPEGTGRFVRLPKYPWKQKKYWKESPDWTRTRNSEQRHPYLMRRQHMPDPTWQMLLNTRLWPYLKDHAIQGRPLFPAAGYLELAHAVATELYPGQFCQLVDVEFERALFLSDGGRGIEVQIQVDAKERQFSILNCSLDQAWTQNARGTIRPRRSSGTIPSFNLQELQSRCSIPLSADQFYAKAEQSSFHYGPMFRGVRQVWRRDGEVLARIQKLAILEEDSKQYQMHPTTLDACIQLAFAVMRENDPQAPVGMFLPYSVDCLQSFAPLPEQFWGHAELVKQGRSSLTLNIRAIANDGRVLVELQGVKFRPMEGTDDENFLNWFYRSEWIEKPRPESVLQHPRTTLSTCLPSLAELGASIRQRAAELRERLLLPHLLISSWQEVRDLQVEYLLEALRELGWDSRQELPQTVDPWISKLGIAEGSRGILEQWLARLQERAGLRSPGTSNAGLPTTIDRSTNSIAARWQSLMDRYPALLSEWMLLKQWGEGLVKQLLGEPTPVPEELVRLREQAIESAPTWMASHLAFRHLISEITARIPVGRRLRILELSAATSGLSAHVIPELTRETAEYTFTDPNSQLPSSTEDRIRQYGYGDCRTLNLAEDPCHQGFELGQFDLVIGQDPWISHGDTPLALRNVWKLLAPGGLLIVSQWDRDAWLRDVLNQVGPVSSGRHRVSQSEWQRMLQDAGFVDNESVSNLVEYRERGRTISISQRPKNLPAEPHETSFPISADCRNWLILADEGGIGNRLAARLREAGHVVQLADSASSLERITTLVSPDLQGVIQLWSLDGPGGIVDQPLNAIRDAQPWGTHSVLKLVQAILGLPAGVPNPRLWLVTRGAQPIGLGASPVNMTQVPLIGLGRVLANEHPDLRGRLIDLSPLAGLEESAEELAREILTGDRDEQVALRGEARYVERTVRMSTLDSPHSGDRGRPDIHPCQVRIGRPGILDQIRLRPIERRAPGSNEVEVAVGAAGLNFRDVMKSLGVYPGDAPDAASLGDEFAGVVVRVGDQVRNLTTGDRVLGVTLGAMATHVTVPAEVCLPLPATMSFEEAATIPVVYLTAFHALHRLAHAQAGERILIHSAAGGVGWAAVRLALQAGLEVFGTAGSAMKRQLLRSIGVQHVSNSRTLEFADEIMALTRGEGIDIVLNSLAGEAIPRSLETLRLYGRFLEIGKRDIYGGTAINLKPFRNSLSYHAIDMARTLVPPYAGPILQQIRKLIESGTVVPLPYQSFPMGEAPRAFRHMAQGKHIGKIVLTADQTPVTRRHAYNSARERYRPDGTYLITGGLRGLGLYLAEHLARRGARYLVLTSYRGPESEESQAGLDRLRSMGVQVLARKSDVASEGELSDLLAEVDRTLPPLIGVIHAATAYGDGLIREMTAEEFEKPMEPKAYGAWNLHRQTLSRKLDLFVMVSSISAVIGNAGQANYVAANTFLDTLAQQRRAMGLPALSLQLDRIRDVGHVSRNQELTDHFTRLRWWGITAEQAGEGLDRLLANQSTTGLISSFKWTRGTTGIGTLISSPRFESLVRDESPDVADGSLGIRRRLEAAAPEEKPEILRGFFLREIADVLRTSAKKLPQTRPLKELGLDSLMAVELMTRIESKLGTAIPAQHLSADATVQSLTNAAFLLLGITVDDNTATRESSRED